MDPFNDANQTALAALARAKMAIARATVRGVNEDADALEYDLEILAGERASGVEVMEALGLTSVADPAETVEVVVVHVMGNRDHPIVIGGVSRARRPKIPKGGTALYTPGAGGGIRIHCLADGSIELTPGAGQVVRVASDLEVDGNIAGTGNVDVDGDVEDGTCTMAAMRTGFAAHVHSGVQGGGSTSGPPTSPNC